MNNKIIILTNGNLYSKIILQKVIEQYKRSIDTIVVIDGDYKGRVGIYAGFQLLRSMALTYFLYKVSILLFVKIGKIIFRKVSSVEELAATYCIPVKHFHSVRDQEAVDFIVGRQADLIISVSCPQMIGKRILESAKLGGINIHSSLLPSYAGLAPYFWVLSKGEKITGTTIHYMTLKFDQGNILAQGSLEIIPGESVAHLFNRLATLGQVLLVEGVEKAVNRDPGYKQDLSRVSYYSNPDCQAVDNLHKNDHCLIKWQDLKQLIS